MPKNNDRVSLLRVDIDRKGSFHQWTPPKCDCEGCDQKHVLAAAIGSLINQVSRTQKVGLEEFLELVVEKLPQIKIVRSSASEFPEWPL